MSSMLRIFQFGHSAGACGEVVRPPIHSKNKRILGIEQKYKECVLRRFLSPVNRLDSLFSTKTYSSNYDLLVGIELPHDRVHWSPTSELPERKRRFKLEICPIPWGKGPCRSENRSSD
eukprot:1153450-Pelagomonas_calceolata.AAC.1